MQYEYLQTEKREHGIVVLTISAPRSLNALNTALLHELEHFLTSIDTSDTRVLILTGAGDKAFVAGADISEMAAKSEAEGMAFGQFGDRCHQRLCPWWRVGDTDGV